VYCGAALTTTTTSLTGTLGTTLGLELTRALERRGFERLTPVQEAVLAPELEGRDLRISSQTGSGKTVAIGFVLRKEVAPEGPAGPSEEAHTKGREQRAKPHALVVTPTRELAKQVEEELAWLYSPLRVRIASVTGGGGYRDELRAFSARPAVIVGTPGRLLDHLKRGAIDASSARAIVLDEADRMLDLGFREDLEAILGYAPPEHRTHLVSATFPREVKALADRVQRDAAIVEGTPLGTANLDIEHLVHLVHPKERLAAIVNLLLENPGTQTLIFARTRAAVGELAAALADAGFSIAMLSGEMEQPERNRALLAFKRGRVDALVATDVAARGIDVQDVARVLHADPPDDADAYTHRSGRTGRAGKKGTSSVLVTTSELARMTSVLARARVQYRFAPVPSAETIRDASDESMLHALTADFVEGETVDPRSLALAERIALSSEPTRAIARLVARSRMAGAAEPRDVTPITPPTTTRREPWPSRSAKTRPTDGDHPGWTAFHVSWGEAHGADARRLVAMMCRRGRIDGRDIGAIRVGRTSSVIEVSIRVASAFEEATKAPDPRDPRVRVRRWSETPVHRNREQPQEAAAPARERPSKRSLPERPSQRALPKERPSTAGQGTKAHPLARSNKDAPAKSPRGPKRRPGAKGGWRGGDAPPKRRPR
jgi:ATP-dependent RNA helicase DeaD